MGHLALESLGQDPDAAQEACGTFAFTAAPPPREDVPHLFLDPDHRFQSFLGMGAAITDASAEVFAKLPEKAQRTLLKACWNPTEGNGYRFCRTSIHSCDFSSASYTYCDEGDDELKSFSIAPDLRYRIPMIQAAREASGGQLRLLASPWSAPGWMKDTGTMLEGGRLRSEHHGTWARYIARFLGAWTQEGLPFWGLTVQNEPAATQRWESMLWDGLEERDFLRDHLAPALASAGFGALKVLGWDHNRDLLPTRARALLSGAEGTPDVWGVGFHWYETWSGSAPLHSNVAAVHEAYPDTPLIMTEACVEGFERGEIDAWAHAERHASEIIGDLAAGASAWIAWNVLLDFEGGPNHVGNTCFAPIHGDPETGEVQFTRSHAVLGQFSRHLAPGAQRIAASTTRSALRTVAFRNPDGTVVAFLLNQSDAAETVHCTLGDRQVALPSPPRTLQTLRCQA